MPRLTSSGVFIPPLTTIALSVKGGTCSWFLGIVLCADFLQVFNTQGSKCQRVKEQEPREKKQEPSFHLSCFLQELSLMVIFYHFWLFLSNGIQEARERFCFPFSARIVRADVYGFRPCFHQRQPLVSVNLAISTPFDANCLNLRTSQPTSPAANASSVHTPGRTLQ